MKSTFSADNYEMMDIQKEKKKHIAYLNQDKFIIDVPNHFFGENHIKLLEKNGNWYKALELGLIQPITDSQNHFIKAVKNEYPILGEHEDAWSRYKLAKQNWGKIYEILQKSNDEERDILAKILRSKTNDVEDLLKDLIWHSQNIIDYMESKTSYTEILEKVANKLKIENLNVSNKKLERSITLIVFNNFIAKMTPEQKEKFEKEIISIAKKENGTLLKTGGAITALTAANLSGFGVYLLATSTLSTISGIIGVTLPFAAYTTLTSAISIITGPVGWASAGIFAIWKITNVNFKKLTPAIIYISWLREKYS